MRHRFSALRVKALVYAAIVLGSMAGCGRVAVFAQATAPAPALKVRLTTTETVAINSLAEKLAAHQAEISRLQAQLQAIEGEIAVEHPGYHFDEPSGEIVANPVLPAAAKEPEKKQP